MKALRTPSFAFAASRALISEDIRIHAELVKAAGLQPQ